MLRPLRRNFCSHLLLCMLVSTAGRLLAAQSTPLAVQQQFTNARWWNSKCETQFGTVCCKMATISQQETGDWQSHVWNADSCIRSLRPCGWKSRDWFLKTESLSAIGCVVMVVSLTVIEGGDPLTLSPTISMWVAHVSILCPYIRSLNVSYYSLHAEFERHC